MTIAPQERILQSATRLFTEHGYQCVTLRQIAEDAEVNASLIIRHFCSKDALFLRIVDERIHSMHVPAVESTEHFGEAIVASILGSIDDPSSIPRSMSALLDASDSRDIREEISKITTKFFARPIISQLRGDHKELRAALVVSQVTGLVTQLHKLQNPVLTSCERGDIISYYGRSIQLLLDAR